MVTTPSKVIKYLRKLSQYRERPKCDPDGMPYYASSGNYDDSYRTGTTDGAIILAKALIDALDNGADMPDLPEEDDDE